MKIITKFNIVLWIIILFIVVISIMAKLDVKYVKYVQSQMDFCNVISTYRDIYEAEQRKDFYMDRKSNLTSIYNERTSKIKTVLGIGKVQHWKGVIKNITVFDGKGVSLSMKLSCNSTLETNDFITATSPLYQKLRKYSENAEITFSGIFVINNVNYGEKSWTENGSMDEPEFHFTFSDFHEE